MYSILHTQSEINNDCGRMTKTRAVKKGHAVGYGIRCSCLSGEPALPGSGFCTRPEGAQPIVLLLIF